ncbi:hypothetical protein HPB49_020755 [Dermacentor silvarum]|uniref:Uncharacterized protein n=1 Tax=Dermacentor silvarum TaxID=543639 RepID=A0ACB8CHD5_DERSI|nr:hypothetical protein HPB49_020755 [Dermacentor silvarum]
MARVDEMEVGDVDGNEEKGCYKCLSVELFCGTPLCLPDDFSPQPRTAALSSHEYVHYLRDLVRDLKRCPPRPFPAFTRYISTDLANATHVFVRHGPIQPALHPHYVGLVLVLERRESTYTVDIHGKTGTIALDPLKPAYCEAAPTVASLNLAPDVSFLVAAYATSARRV